jgi:hypothetical protein
MAYATLRYQTKKSGLTAITWLTRSALGTRREIIIAIPT